ncbi:unnamed protein product [Amaranthus hypochondriacus]
MQALVCSTCWLYPWGVSWNQSKGRPGRILLGVRRGTNLLDFAIGVYSKNNWVDEACKAQEHASNMDDIWIDKREDNAFGKNSES